MTTLFDLASRHSLSPRQVTGLETYVDQVLGWRRGRVTGLRRRGDALDTLVGDALALLDMLPVQEAAGAMPPGRLLDLGSGNGAPGLPLAVAAPELRVVLLDSAGKKCEFLSHVVAQLGLSGRVLVVCARSEAYTAAGAEGREAFDLVTARAVGELAEIVELAAPALAVGGRLLAVKSGSGVGREKPAGDAAATVCGLDPGPVVRLEASPVPDSVCAAYRKVARTPDWLPRRPGVAGRRPLPA